MTAEQVKSRLEALHSCSDGWMWGKGKGAAFDLSSALVMCSLFAVDSLALRKDGALVITARAKREIIEITMIGEDPISIEKKSIM